MESKKRKIPMFNRGELLRTLESWNRSQGMINAFIEHYGKELKPNRSGVEEFEKILRNRFIYEMSYDEFTEGLDEVLKVVFPNDHVISHLVNILRRNYEHLTFTRDGSYLNNRIFFKAEDCCLVRHRLNKRTEELYVKDGYITTERIDEVFEDFLQNYEAIPVQFWLFEVKVWERLH